jgi:hypothetical protein
MRFAVSAVASWLAVMAVFTGSAGTELPRIDLIEPFLTNQVVIHFNTAANLNYELQFLDNWRSTNGVPMGTWSNLFSPPTLPFPNHYVVPDTRSSPQRFYRLRVTP